MTISKIYGTAVKYLSVLILFWGLLAAEAEPPLYKVRPFEEKISGDGLSLAVTFDKFHTNADFAKGNPNSSLSKLPLGLRNHVGIDGKNAFAPEADEQLNFLADGNCDIARGTAVIWVRCDYPPNSNNGNIGIMKACWNMNTSRDEKTTLGVYIFKGKLHAFWMSDIPPKTFGEAITTKQGVSLEKIRQGEWFQVAVSWDETRLALYMNGELKETASMRAKFRKVAATGYDPDTSMIGFKTSIWGDKNKVRTVIDDIRVYNRVLSNMEIRSGYLALCVNPNRMGSPVEINLSGVEKEPTTMEAEIEFCPLPALADKKASVGLTGPDGFSVSRQIPASGKSVLHFKSVTRPGEYHLKVTSGEGKKQVSAEKKIKVPDLSFINFCGGDDGTVPAPFKPVKVDPVRKTVSVWNKILRFENSPYPVSILCSGKEMFAAKPELKIPDGEILWNSASLESWKEGGARLTGSGKLPSGEKITFETIIEFDGLFRTEITFCSRPVLAGLSLNWRVAPDFCEFLQIPGLQKSGKLAVPWPISSAQPFLIWLASEQGGLSWMPHHDFNWVRKEKDIVFEADRTTGNCRVTLISSKVKVPSDEFKLNTGWFLATPTHPLTEPQRGLRMGGHPEKGGFDLTMCNIALYGGFRMHPDFEKLFPIAPGISAERSRKLRRFHSVYYGMTSPWGGDFYRYFKKYISEPSGFTYTSNHLRDPRNDKLILNAKDHPMAPCRMDSQLYHNYVMWHLDKLLRHPLADRIAQIYNDLCSVYICGSELDFLKDDFGREIRPLNIAGCRRFLIRELRLCHRAGLPLMLHAQRKFIPAMHSLADYWLPGEQYEPAIRRTQNIFFYSDVMDDTELRCEANSRLLGVNVVFLAEGMSYTGKKDMKAYLDSFFSVFLPYDIEYRGNVWNWRRIFRDVHEKVWSIYEHAGVFGKGVKAYRFFDPMPITVSNHDIRLAFYEMPGGNRLLIMANKTKNPVTGIVDLSKTKSGNFTLPELYANEKIEVKSGKFKITVPPRTIRITEWKQ